MSPLVEIKAEVQARAKDLTLSVGADPDRATLGEPVERAIADWEAEYGRDVALVDDLPTIPPGPKGLGAAPWE